MRWVTRPGDGRTVGHVLARAKADPNALAEGRVFVGPKRVSSRDQPIAPGDVVEIAPSRAAAPRATILARTGDLVAVDKPPGVSTIPDHRGSTDALIALAARVLRLDAGRLHATSRLDRDVSGVVIFALTGAASERLLAARRAGTYERRYVAIASRSPEPGAGTWSGPIGRAPDPRLRKIGGPGAVHARTRYATAVALAGGPAMLAVMPATGRTHQIRVHASSAGAPLVGDRSYGGPARVVLDDGRVVEPRRIALHAWRVTVPGEDGRPWTVTSPVPADLRSLWTALGGEGEAWDLSASCFASSSPPSPSSPRLP